MKIGVMFGSPETTSGGNALKFYSSVRLDIRRIGAIKEAAAGGKEPNVVGNRTRVKVVKNKMAPPFREVEFDILYGQGISHSGDVIDLAVEANIVEKSGAWFSFQGERIGQGRENARTFLEQHPRHPRQDRGAGPGQARHHPGRRRAPRRAERQAADGRAPPRHGAGPPAEAQADARRRPTDPGRACAST